VTTGEFRNLGMGGFQGYEDQKKEWYGLGTVLELSSVRCHLLDLK
jgi:hypothetical protein